MREKVIEHKLLTEVKKIGLRWGSRQNSSSARWENRLCGGKSTGRKASTTPTGKAQATPQTGVQGVCTGQPSTDWRDN